jgi:hypothetical protein
MILEELMLDLMYHLPVKQARSRPGNHQRHGRARDLSLSLLEKAG